MTAAGVDAAVPYRSFAHPLTQVRTARGWSLQDTAGLVARRAAELGLGRGMAVDRQKVWRWEYRGVVPHEEARYALGAALGVPARVVRATAWPDWLPAARGVALGRQAGSGLAGHPDALRTLADWLEAYPVPGAGAVVVAPDGVVSVHVEPLPGGPPPQDVLRGYAAADGASTLAVGPALKLAAGRWARPLRLTVPVPGVALVLWCHEVSRSPDPHEVAQ